jgi:hypothetical protein
MPVLPRGTRCLRVLGFLATLALLIGAGATHAAARPAAQPDRTGLKWSATVNGRTVSAVDTNNPLVLDPDGQTLVVLDLANTGSAPIKVRAIRLEGRVMNMTFFRYTTRLEIELAPGASTQRRFELDLDELEGQAVGLIPTDLKLLDSNRKVLQHDAFPVDVKGSMTSVYGIFGLAVAGITAILLVSLLLAIARRRLSRNRWKRGLTFLAVGAGLGLTLTFTLSATRLLTPSSAAWLTLVAAFAIGGFALGYILPLGMKAGPDREDEDYPDQYDDQAGPGVDRGMAATTADQAP